MFPSTKRKLTRMKVKVFDTVVSALVVLAILAYCNADAQTDVKSTIPIGDGTELLADETHIAERETNLAAQLDDQLSSEREATGNAMSPMLRRINISSVSVSVHGTLSAPPRSMKCALLSSQAFGRRRA